MGRLEIITMLWLLQVPCEIGAEGTTEGRSFVVGFAESIINTGTQSKIRILNSGTVDASVTISSLPTAPQAIADTFTVSPGQHYAYSVHDDFEMPVGNGIANLGLKTESSAPVVIYIEDADGSNTDSFPLLPTPLLGKEYFVASYNKTNDVAASFLLVVAQYDRTRVKISMDKLMGGEKITLSDVIYGQNDVVDVELHALQTLQIQTESDLSGTKIISSNPVAVFSGVNRTSIPAPQGTGKCLSHLSEQLPPLSNWGTKFVLISSPNQTAGDIYRFVCGWDGTDVTLYTDTPQTVRLETPGQVFEIDLENGKFVYVQSDKPIMVYQVMKSLAGDQPGGDPAMGIHAPLEQAESQYTFVSDAVGNYKQYIAVVVNSTEQDGIELNGTSLTSYDVQWWPVPETSLTVGFILLEDLSRQIMTLSHVYGHVFGAHSYVRVACECRIMPFTYGRPLRGFQYLTRIAETAKGERSDVFVPIQSDARRSADRVNTLTAMVPLACAQACMKDVDCWGYNFNPSTSIGDNCELILEDGGVMVNSPGWSFVERWHE